MQSAVHKVFSETVGGAQAEQLEMAAASIRAALKAAPDDANCLHVIGLIECQLGRLETAKQWIEKSLAVRPDAADVQCHYGLLLMEQKKYAEAVVVFKRTLALDSDNVETYYHLANALNESGQIAEAMTAYLHVLNRQPNHAKANNNLGNIAYNHGNPKEALPYYRRAVATQPDYAMAYNNMGLAHIALGELEIARENFRKALALNPEYPDAHNNLGIVFRLEGKFEDSKAWYDKALALRPDFPDALNNLGNVLKDLGRLDESIAYYRKALRLKDSVDHHHNLGIALLAAGQFHEGWREYEARWQLKQLAGMRRNFTQPQWCGEPAEGRTLLIHAEQGFGDTLQFCRYVPLAKARGLRVVLEVQPALAKLMESLDGVDAVVAHGKALPEFDLTCPTMSLPLAFGTDVDSIPAGAAYLGANPQAVTQWRNGLPDAKGAVRVGLVWAGSARLHSPDLVATDRRRSITPELLVPLLDASGVQFYSLQKNGPPAPAEFGLIDCMEQCSDFADTAALIANLDLVISVDTAVAHLAGAMGKPVWVLNRFDSCWRWLQNRNDSPWYPTLRLFRQASPGDWDGVISRVRDALVSFVAER